MSKLTKLQWEKSSGDFDLRCLNPDQLDEAEASDLLEKVKYVYDDFKKPFNKKAALLLENWIKHPDEPLPEAAYCLLSNWFLSGKFAHKTIRAGYAQELWQLLFCALPERRLTNWHISGEKVIHEEFDLWWTKLLRCQGNDR